MPAQELQLLDLPDELLVEVLSHLDTIERHAALPLVCSRLHSLLYSPRLLRHVAIVHQPTSPQPLRSLLNWLAACCAGRMKNLDLHLGMDYLEEAEALTCSELAGQLLPVLAACGAAGGLESLTVNADSEIRLSALVIGGWAAAMRGLKHLDLSWSGELRITTPLRSLESLQSLRLRGAPLRLPTDAALPPSLGALSIGANLGQGEGPLPLPLQIASLPQLRVLELQQWYQPNGPEDSQGWRPLEALAGTLQQLCLHGVARLPPNLGQPTALTRLAIRNHFSRAEDASSADAANQGILEAALPRLCQLACLVVPVAGSGLRQLPPGDWLASLRVLVLPARAAAASLPVLAAATGVQRFGLYYGDEPVNVADFPRLLRWAAGSPALLTLMLQLRQFGCGIVDALLELQRSKPQLAVKVTPRNISLDYCY
ncbi:adenylate cyclase regulatory [Chlorella sorokiniana]|uniref:Adenylate cyclase regulatory n=1 Tax=Chlorella sorokiniana TaxID=3076 RepID=A0A2P6TLN8_CHLSO|nr:adenylate cyclase regulatory [Chlorella sorokiniana]|eukprot:PRW45204.1 adenylate cyclase regulatory [Chlorella sorokiniana]